jgi:thymidylate synthase ThyX
MPYNDRPDGRWRYHVPAELSGGVRTRFVASADRAFELYTKLFEPLQDYLKSQYPQPDGTSGAAYRMSIRAKACDILRGLLPAATTSNVGIYGSAQGYEALLLRLLSHELAEARELGEAMLAELKKVVPVFVERVERQDRGGVFIDYLRRSKDEARRRLSSLTPAIDVEALNSSRVDLTDFAVDGETKVTAAILFELAGLSDDDAMATAGKLSPADRAEIIAAYAGPRSNRRHRPGRAFERSSYRFEIAADYGAFRDLQRHRLLTLEWQLLNPYLGFDLPPEICAIGAEHEWSALMRHCRAVYEELRSATSETVAQYIVPMAYRIRFVMEMNAREAMHVIELRTTEQAHRNYRVLCLEMHRLIGEHAGHHAIADAIRFVGESDGGLERLSAEQRIEDKRSAIASRLPR